MDEVLARLADGSLDDDIWGKVVLMERGFRVAKAYLRQPTLIVDGGDEEFDGHTLGFNFFRGPHTDAHSAELRDKIGDVSAGIFEKGVFLTSVWFFGCCRVCLFHGIMLYIIVPIVRDYAV